MSNGVSPHSVRIEPHQPHTELPKASHLHLTVKPPWKTLLSPVLPHVYPRARAKAQLPFPALPAVERGFLLPPTNRWNTDFTQQAGRVWMWSHLEIRN